MQGDKRTSCECPTRGNPEIDNHLLSGRRPTSPYKGIYPSHPQGCDKNTRSFRYSSDKTVPWNYTNQVTSQEPQAVRVSPEMKQEPLINDIVRTGGLTRSGRCYAPSLSRVKEREKGTKQCDVKVVVSKRKGKEQLNEPITKTEANEFLKFIKHNEYSTSSSYISCLLRSLY